MNIPTKEQKESDIKSKAIVDNFGRTRFLMELEQLINKHSQENRSNTPDFILAEYLNDCLRYFNIAVNAREMWHDRKPVPIDDVDRN